MPARNMAFDFVPTAAGELNIVVLSSGSPSNVEWDAYLRTIQAHEPRFAVLQGLVLSDGGGPSAAQRKALIQLLKGIMIPTCVVSSSSVVRGIITAIGWFNPKIRSFEPQALADVFAQLELTPDDIARVESTLARLRDEVAPIRDAAV